MRKRRNAGSALIEFTVVGIPMIFVLLSTFEIARGMWIYETLSYAVREGTRFAIVHGQGCANASPACAVTTGAIVQRIRDAGVGLMPVEAGDLVITLASSTRPGIRCVPDVTGTAANCTDSGCFPSGCGGTVDIGGMAGMPVTITATYSFRSAIAMFWPGTNPIVYGTVPMIASSRELVQF
jgi:hypothetical protein